MSNAMINACDETLELRLDTGWGRHSRYVYSPIHTSMHTHTHKHSHTYTGHPVEGI